MVRRLPDDYVDLDEMLTRFGTMYAIARWGDGVSMVQVKVGHRRVPGFAKRARVDSSTSHSRIGRSGGGRRLRGDAGAQAAFDDYVERASRRPGAEHAVALEDKHVLHGAAAARILSGGAVLGLLVSNSGTVTSCSGPGSVWARPCGRSRRGTPRLADRVVAQMGGTAFLLYYLAVIVVAVLWTLGWQTRLVGPAHADR